MRNDTMIRLLTSDSLPEMQRPAWLKEGAVAGPVPIRDLLEGSVYYPASGLDGDPMMHLGHYFWSFVYVDYGFTPESIVEALDPASLRGELRAGYALLARRSITEDELPLASWHADSGGWLGFGNNKQAWERATPPFAEWALLERNYGPDKPRELMSLLFLGADGVTLFTKLYVENAVAPACIAIIQPGNGMGDQNWTDFNDPNTDLAKAVMTNPAGAPSFLLYGGNGKAEWYKEPCWPPFGRRLAWPLERTEYSGSPFRRRREGALSLWERTVHSTSR